MFTIKLYKHNGQYRRIYEADSFTVLTSVQGGVASPRNNWHEITAHMKSGHGLRFDIGDSPYEPSGGKWDKGIIENAAGRTTEIIGQDVPMISAAA